MTTLVRRLLRPAAALALLALSGCYAYPADPYYGGYGGGYAYGGPAYYGPPVALGVNVGSGCCWGGHGHWHR